MEQYNRIGIVGGTFNPIHLAHLIIAEIFAEQAQLDRTFFVPANLSPFKLDNNQLNLTTPAQRLEMVRLAVAGNPRFEVDSYEMDNNGISYSYDTVRYFKQKFPGADIFLLIGTDQAREFTRWFKWNEIINEAQLCIVSRYNHVAKEEKDQINDMLTVSHKSPVWIEAPGLEISSTDIRKRLSLGMSIKYLVPPEVEAFIHANRLYR